MTVGYKARWGVWCPVAFLIPVPLIFHAFWRWHDTYVIHVQQAMVAKKCVDAGRTVEPRQ
jgi:hypothetical protein